MSGRQHIHELIPSIYLRPSRGAEGVNEIEIWNNRLGDGQKDRILYIVMNKAVGREGAK